MSVIQDIFAEAGSTAFGRFQWWADQYGTSVTTSGVEVDPDKAMSLADYYAAIRNIAEDLAKLPFKTYRQSGKNNRTKEPATDHPAYLALQGRPSPDYGAMTWRETMQSWAMGWGDGYSVITNTGREIHLDLIHPSRVTVKRNDGGRIVYELREADGMTLVLPQDKIFHLHGLGDGLHGWSIAKLAANTIGLGLALEEFAARFFGQGTSASGVFTTPEELGDQAFERLKATWPKGLPNAHNPIFLEQGMKWEALGVPPEQAQMIESRIFSVDVMARWFRIPPHKLQELTHGTFTNIEVQNREYVDDTLMPWAVRWEQEADAKLLGGDPNLFTRHVFLGLLRGDSAARSAYYRERFNIGTLSRNDIRELEDENPIDDATADQYFVGMNLQTGDKAGEEREGPREAVPPNRFDGNGAEELKRSFVRTFAEAIGRVWRKDAAAAKRAESKHSDPSSFMAWSEEFYENHAAFMAESVLPAATSLGELLTVGEFTLAAEKSIGLCVQTFARDAVAARRDAVIASMREAQLAQYLECGEATEPPRLAAELTDMVELAVQMEQ